MLKLRLGMLLLVLVPLSVQAAVLNTNEWENKTQSGWSYSGTVVDCAVPASPSGGCALKVGTYTAGTYSTSQSFGRTEYGIASKPTDLYLGAWMRYSTGFVFHATGQKKNFFILADQQRTSPGGPLQNTNVTVGYIYRQLGGAPQVYWSGIAQTYNFYQNIATWEESAHTNEWHWYEMHLRMNTPGVRDGLVEVWIDDVLYLRHTNVPIRDVGQTQGFSSIQHTAEYGGGGSTIASTQYWWVDHTVISTTRIGMPGGVQTPGDTQAPTAPSSLVAQ